MCEVAIVVSGLKAAKTKVAHQLRTMVSVHNSSLFDELREDVLQFAEEDDVVEEVAASPLVSKLNMKANAAEYFASKTSPPKTMNSLPVSYWVCVKQGIHCQFRVGST